MASPRLSGALKAYAKNPATLALASSKLGKPPKPAAGAPAKGLPGPALPAVPAAPAAAPMPWDANYETRIGGINRTHDENIAGLANEETGVKQAYGFDDLSNPFSRLALLKEKFADQQRGTTNSMAAQGQLYSGALLNQQGADQHGYDVNYDATRRDYQGALDAITARRTGVNNTQTDDTTAAGWDRTQAALTNRPDPASVPAPAAATVAKPAAAKPAAVAPPKKKPKVVTYTNAVKRP